MMIRQSYKLQPLWSIFVRTGEESFNLSLHLDVAAERGIVAISTGFPKLHSVLYFCRKMTNTILVTIERNRPNMIRFCVCLVEPQSPDYLTHGPLDAGFDAVVHHCKGLRQLSLSGLLTDFVFYYIRAHAKSLEMLFVYRGFHRVLSLEIRDCSFNAKAGDDAVS
ncbi:Protein TRANSPORT INHIBITOR RESPONSE 1 [Capsicum baccatum]|uniref:Protein TRANSPORT INHIBITOR RESPONSE 1 n=1 Tax=Capsicum baccatum TaxID=33114 RepID=A0A2G2WH75_CAPBA|nr:Protein TRANSPORT INHIBITOR RESPONSE 1 [Capsicum baccatum]